MPKQKRRHASRLRNLIVMSTMTAVFLAVSTYAWFIGMRTVNVSSFDVEIAATDSLLLSLDGKTWKPTVEISEANLKYVSYEGHTNTWGGKGLIPMSSIGEMDYDASRMKLFEKASLTATPGGYRLLASRVNNYREKAPGELEPEQDGYVAFDLFIKNFSGTQYIPDLEELDEEAIYLTTDSKVEVAENGVANTGIENSVRVAFAQIGRVAGTTTDDKKITGISCVHDDQGKLIVENDVTGICRTAQIWEPNDTAHVQNAINWYDRSCLARNANGHDVTKEGSYDSTKCATVEDKKAYPTYAVSTDITSSDNINIYDGPKYNGYVPKDGESKLVSYPYFTDSMKILTGVQRPTFMTLAPNSITKVRIYIYIEGQDIDNYDFASIGKKIAVAFGFTKERFIEDDIDYNENDGPELNQGDGPIPEHKIAPVITLKGQRTVIIAKDSTYVDAGATATDNRDVINDEDIVSTGTVDTSKEGMYTITYEVTDSDGNTATKTRTVIVQ